MNLSDTERAAADRLAALCGPLAVWDVTSEPVPPAGPARAAEAVWGAPERKPGKCGCCGKRRDLVAYSGLDAADADLCFRCGSDRAQGLGYCSSRPGEYTHTFSDSDWTV
jgi:hypothetical protein